MSSNSSVFALKRNSSTVRYCFEADAEPGVLPRALELLAKRGLVPARVFAQADEDLLRQRQVVPALGGRNRLVGGGAHDPACCKSRWERQALTAGRPPEGQAQKKAEPASSARKGAR